MFGARVVLATVFLVSAAAKLRSVAAFEAFGLQLRDWTGWPQPLGLAAAVALVTAEVAVPVLLAAPSTAMAGLTLSATLLAVFSAGIATALRRGISSPCRCFGSSAAPLSTRHLVRNGVLLSITLGVLPWAAGTASPNPHPAGLLIAGTAGLVAAGLLIRIDDLVGLSRPASPR